MFPYHRLRSYAWTVFLPLAFVWAIALRARRRFLSGRAQRVDLTVISVGNLHSGGTGKTPVVIEIARRLASRQPVVLSRGYRGKASRSGSWVQPVGRDESLEFGDEPWMMKRLGHAEVYVARDRVGAAKRIASERPGSLLILDDGFQHVRLRRDVDLLLIPAEESWENGFCLPLGEMREGWSAAKAASAILLVGGSDEEADRWRPFVDLAAPGIPCFRARAVDRGLWEGETAFVPAGEKLGGFCGVARPERFAQSLLSRGNSTFLRAFPDHHIYESIDVERLMRDGAAAGVQCYVTTDKDWPKVAPYFSGKGARVFTARIGYEFSDEFWYFLERAIQ